jgi:glycosyltransferase involved in cell wall biosynthesis
MTPLRLAWFSPLPPVRSGIAAYTAELVPLLAEEHGVDVYWAQSQAASQHGAVPDATSHRATGHALSEVSGVQLLSAHEFIPRHTLDPYDLIVYQLGNAACHDDMWPYLLRYPGLVVLHDAALHHSRARALLTRGRRDDYRAEFHYAHPGAPRDLAEFIVEGLQGAPYYLWPLTRIVVEAARVVAVHGDRLAEMLSETYPTAPIRPLRMGVRPHAAAAERREGGPVFACYGLVTPEKRIPQVLGAFAGIAASLPAARLLLVGDTTPYYDLEADVVRYGLRDRVTVTGFVADEVLDEWLDAADVCVCLRWPTTREMSASWLRCLAAGKPTVITDLAHMVGVPSLDPRSWTLVSAREDAAATMHPPRVADAVAVGIDILDEDHSLGLAFQRLAVDATLRETLGRNGRAYWAANHTLAAMADDYRRVIAEACAMPVLPAPRAWPSHLRADGTGLLTSLTAEIGVSSDLI